MTTHTGRAFNEWLRAQLKAKKMSQRQLAQQSGVDHSTISRLIRGDRMPSLGTATALARGLREIREDADTTQYLGVVTNAAANPTARVEYALRADDALGEPQVRQIMEYYLAVRLRRFGRSFSPADAARNGSGANGYGADPRSSGPDAADASASRTAAPRTATGTSGRTAGRAGDANDSGQHHIEQLPVGSRPLGFAHLPPRPQNMVTGSSVRRESPQTRSTTAPTITRQPGRNSDRY